MDGDAVSENNLTSTGEADTASHLATSKSSNRLTLSYPIEDYTPPSSKSKHDLSSTFSWEAMLKDTGFVAAPVSAFKHAPMSDCWENIIVGMKVEVENRDCDKSGVFAHSFWVATVLRLSGYCALLRYEGFGQDGSKDFWINLCSDRLHPVGWCATKGKPLIPPKSIQTKYTDWKEFLVKRLTGARTLPSNFYLKIWDSVDSVFRPGMKLEVVDKMRICQVRVATIMEVTGRRLYLTYDEVDHDDRGFWCHEESPLIHPVGWARKVGHQIVASQEYFDRCAMDNLRSTDCTPDMFPIYPPAPPGSGQFEVGMKIEAVDPLNLATVCVATVMKVLRFGYIMIRIDGFEQDVTGGDWFCYHASSPLIFPPGFCDRNGGNGPLQLKRPTGYEEKFSWYEYLKDNGAKAAPVDLFCVREDVKHGFKPGMRVEATDQMDPRLVCVSTISKVVGRLLKVHFDGWDEEYDQWMDCANVDIYPVGWAELVGHRLEGPRKLTTAPSRKEKRKSVNRKGGKRRGGNNNSGNDNTTTTNVVNGRKSRKVNETTSTEVGRASPPLLPPDHDVIEDNGDVAKVDNETPIPATPKNVVSPKAVETEEVKVEDGRSPESHSVHSVENKNGGEDPPLRVIPRLVDSAGQAAAQRGGKDVSLDPSSWSVDEVAQFLQINECSTLADAFADQKVNGARFLSLVKEDVMKLVNNKIGPCLKIENLLRLLKARMNPAQARYLSSMTRKT